MVQNLGRKKTQLKKKHIAYLFFFAPDFEQSLTPTLILTDHEFKCKNVKSILKNGPNAGPKPISVMPEIAENSYFQFPLKSVIRLLAKSGKINGPGGPLRVHLDEHLFPHSCK